MAAPTLLPASQTSAVRLPSTGSLTIASVSTNYPYGLYVTATKTHLDNPDLTVTNELYDINFITGAVEQVSFTYKKLGGDVLDIELTDKNIYAAYEEAVLEYSYIVNVHQAKNMLHNSLGATTGTFDSDGQRTDILSGSNVELKYPKFSIGYSKRIMDDTSTESGMGGTSPIYSASISTTLIQQDYDLQALIQASSSAPESDFYNKVNNKRVIVRQIFYKTPHAMWRFYGYYGGLNTIGNLSTYGMYADDSTFEIIPPWQNKLQAMAYEDAIYTRNSHYSYELKNNHLRIYPVPTDSSPRAIWVRFTVEEDPWDDQSDRLDKVAGINNMNTLPLANIPYANINSIGKQWIRRFAVSLSKETLGYIRSKFSTVPIPGANVTLNGKELVTQAKAEQKELREELQKVLDEMTYEKMTELQSKMVKNTQELARTYPYFIFTG
jgi:hypothetical protein